MENIKLENVLSFQSLIGKVQLIRKYRLTKLDLFQSLIGKVQPKVEQISVVDRKTKFQSLIGKVQHECHNPCEFELDFVSVSIPHRKGTTVFHKGQTVKEALSFNPSQERYNSLSQMSITQLLQMTQFQSLIGKVQLIRLGIGTQALQNSFNPSQERYNAWIS